MSLACLHYKIAFKPKMGAGCFANIGFLGLYWTPLPPEVVELNPCKVWIINTNAHKGWSLF